MRQRKNPEPDAVRPRTPIKHSSSPWQTTGITSGLVVAAVLVGVLFYAQAGLLIGKPLVGDSRERTNESRQTPQPIKSSEHAEQATLGVQNPTPSKKESPISPAAKAPSPETHNTCDSKAKKDAQRIYDRSMSAEKTLHQKNLAGISRLSKVLSSLKLAGNKTAAENSRHNTTVEAITVKYEQALMVSRCSS